MPINKQIFLLLLTHWGRLTHICISELTIIGSDNGLSPRRRQTIIWNNVNWTLRNKLQWNFNRNSNIFIQENALEHVVCEMASILSRPQCVNVGNIGFLLDTLHRNICHSSLYNVQSRMKCLSSSITLHLEHSLLLLGVLGLVYLPRSISRGWELDRIFVIAFRYLESFSKSRYVLKWKPFLMFLYNFCTILSV